MLAEVVFVAFDVFVEEFSGLVDGEGRHVEREDLLRGGKTFACLGSLEGFCERQAVELAVAREDAALRIFLNVCREVERAIGRYRERGFSAAEGGEPDGRAAICRNGPNVFAALAPGGEDDEFAVGSPDRLGVVGRVGGELGCLTACHRNSEQVALIDENYLGCVGGNCILAEPAGCGLCRGCDREQRGEKGRNNSHIANIRK